MATKKNIPVTKGMSKAEIATLKTFNQYASDGGKNKPGSKEYKSRLATLPGNTTVSRQDIRNDGFGNISIPENSPLTPPDVPVNSVAPDQTTPAAPVVDSRTVLRAYLNQYELGDLTDDTYKMLAGQQITAETNIDVIGELLKDTYVYQTRFAGNVTRAANKQATYSISEYLTLEDNYKAAMQGSGLPTSFYDSPKDYANFIGGDVSVAEVQRRVDEGFKAVNDANPEVVKQLKSLYNVGDGGIAAYFLDPTKATDMLVKQAAAAGRSAQAQLQAGMQLTQTQAEGLVADNVSTQAAQQGFTEIGKSQGLYSNLIGETGAITQEEQIAGTFGTNQAAAQRIAQRKRQRQAEFTTGGTFTTTQGGVSGLGSANK